MKNSSFGILNGAIIINVCAYVQGDGIALSSEPVLLRAEGSSPEEGAPADASAADSAAPEGAAADQPADDGAVADQPSDAAADGAVADQPSDAAADGAVVDPSSDPKKVPARVSTAPSLERHKLHRSQHCLLNIMG